MLQGTKIEDRNDRPDILHFGLLTAIGYRNIVPNLRIQFSSKFGVFELDNSIKLPRSQQRFYGLLETILQNIYTGDLIRSTENNILKSTVPKIMFTKGGTPIEEINLQMFDTFIFGGFSTGSFRDSYPNSLKVSLSDSSLDLWTAISLFFSKYLR